MSESGNLDNVILQQTIPSETKLNRAEGKIIRIDTATGEILYKKPLFSFLRRVRYYFVFSQTGATLETGCTVNDFSTDQAITINIKYEVKCRTGSEETIVKALYKGTSPDVVLNELIETWVTDFTGDKKNTGGNPVLNFFSYRERLKRTLTEKILKKVGLEAEFALTLKNESELKIHQLKTEYFPVRVKDYSNELKIKLDIGMGIHRENRIHAVLNSTKIPELEQILKETIYHFILEEVTLHQYLYALNTSVKSRLSRALDTELNKKGRRISWLNLETDETAEIPEQSRRIHHTTKCDIKDYSKKVEINHKLLMQLEDIGKYKSVTHSGDREEYIKKKLAAITQSILFDKKYIEILLDFDGDEEKQEILNKIKEGMQEYLASIGYTVKHLIVEPDVEPLKFKRDGFRVEIEGAEFATLDSRVKIKLNIAASGKLKDLKKISKYITPEKDLKKEIKHVIREETRRIMHGIDPEDFYMPRAPHDDTVAMRLVTNLKDKLNAVFHTEDVLVTIKTAETELINRLEKLKTESPYTFETTIFPQRGAGKQESVKIEVEFLIRGVSKGGWYAFISRNLSHKEELARIWATLEKDIKEKFQKVPAEILMSSDVKEWKKLAEIARLCHTKIAVIFGVEITISGLNRQATRLEKAHQEILDIQIDSQKTKELEMLELKDQADMTDLEYLLDKRTGMLDPDLFEEDDLDQIDGQIEKISNKSAYPSQAGQKILKASTPESADDFNINEFAEELKDDTMPPGAQQGKPLEKIKDKKNEKKIENEESSE